METVKSLREMFAVPTQVLIVVHSMRFRVLCLKVRDPQPAVLGPIWFNMVMTREEKNGSL